MIEFMYGYWTMCIFFGTFYPWYKAGIYYIILLILGFSIKPFRSNNIVKKASIFMGLYLGLTPVVFTIIGALDVASGGVSTSDGLKGLPNSADFALAHAFFMWGVVSFIFGGIIRGAVSLSKAKQKQLSSQPKNDDTFKQ